jgi:hypothetical protein
MKRFRVLIYLVGALLVSLAGCGPGDYVGTTCTVKGKITVKGVPATHGSIAFWPDASKGNTGKYEASGGIKEDGTYTMQTKGKPGVPPGAYKVTVSMQTQADIATPTKFELEIPKEYTQQKTTKLSVEVVASPAPGAYDLDLK